MPHRLLLLNTDLEIGGTPTVVRELALRLRSPQVDVQVACLAGQGPVGRQLQSAGVQVTPLNARSRWDLGTLTRLLSHLKRQQIDTVLSFLVHGNAIAAAAHLRRQKGKWYQSLQTTQPTPRWHWKVQGIAAHMAERIIVPSESVARSARNWARIQADKITVIPNGLDLAAFASVRAATKSSGPFRVGFIGRLDPVKRIGDLVSAMSQLNSDDRLDIYGEGSERSRIESQIALLGMKEKVTLHGAVASPLTPLANMDVLVLTSAAEGFGFVLIEAFAAGVPVVATDAPGIRDVVAHGKTGMLVPVGAINELTQAIRSVRENPLKWQTLVAAARREVELRYTWNQVIPRYRSVLGLPGGAASSEFSSVTPFDSRY